MYRYSYFLLIFFLLQCFPAPKIAGQFTQEEFDEMASFMARGGVKDMTIQELIQVKEEVILLDAREKEEFEISHIPGAIWVGYDDFSIERLKGIDKNKPVVTYCSVGYRSERIGEKLQKEGFTNVQNFEGSIFRWMNEEQRVVNKDNQITNKVHGFNDRWGKWVKNGEVVFE